MRAAEYGVFGRRGSGTQVGGSVAQAAGPALSPGRAGEGLQGFAWSTGDGLCPGSQNPPPLMSVPFPAVPSDHSLALTLASIRQGLDGPQSLRQNVVILLESRPLLPLFYLKQQMREDVVRGKLTVDIFKWTRSSRKRRAVQKAPPSLWTGAAQGAGTGVAKAARLAAGGFQRLRGRESVCNKASLPVHR